MRRSDQRRDAVFALYQHEVTGQALNELLDGARPFTRELVEGVQSSREEIDQRIAAHSHGWELNRIAALECSIMRVALFESAFRDDIPTEVSLDEAVGFAKRFCGEKAPGFVNGVLAAEVGADRDRNGTDDQ